MKKSLVSVFLLIFLSGCTFQNSDESYIGSVIFDSGDEIEEDYDYGYEWAEDNDIDNFEDCQDQFGTSDAENGCNDYVKDNYTGYKTFYGYDCTEDCSGHEAGYKWAEENDINNIYDCDGNSDSFIEGCQVYVEENY